MAPITVGIGGAHSGVGKTSLASLILKRLKGWGAIKYTNTPLYCSIIDDIEILSEPGKDTKRLLDAGAEKVLWVQSPSSELGDVLPRAIEILSHLKGIMVEGNGAVEALKPDIVIFVCGTKNEEFKKSAENLLNMADVVLCDEVPSGIPEVAKKFRKEDIDECVNFVIDAVRKISV
ncbi:MAG: hypothetical protein AB1390_01330 [Nitrospirota bacterium]